ncbi:hypothetical protein AUEXF2481DRAFT_562693 [Aureobasidium subglaciale EXF-2481]|uniref:GIT Spa2 homology (SHD) domain-containing protein n=1 Tax=Aureobasidium subglaciale (strain EXF-2481) TaxID=1043005 RepID=A0A074ZHI8_AURSE|nr:uncharacterized protein AUEXF2481DRAFT_562693 [Aureobasidium subglaciale EXF-2481]KAI5202512.1 hypothetical protein E4T38_05583 [Aureobasidium subglaciale]KAI5221346.1 hypothetical protein E4T40_05516 [Aureobasidium subglaciale]KAI5225288.1 hypothetical protein E4T41_05335 [Aureobasidium subglaciale]KAI5261336.1 hypothetical protein E4T46_05241 [Aureobasidium subglaciale]KEQ98041.1 hypothetical protein AUEXF2481DRAFT_562693 [Aureobasidium subglaciale EXF-2481]
MMHAPNRSRDDTLSGRGYQGPPLGNDPYAAAASRTAVPIQNSPPLSQGSTDNSLSSRARSQRSPSATNSHISSSSSVSGAGFYSPANSEFRQSVKSTSQEAALTHHYNVLKVYLARYLRDEQGNTRPTRARDKLLRLSPTQFNELSTDVFDELQRREDDRRRPGGIVPPSLPPRNIFHPKRNQARQKLSTLPPERFRQLATDVFFELERRMPGLVGADGDRPGSPTGSVASRGSARTSSRQGPPYAMRRPSGQQNGMRGPPPPGTRPGPPSNGPYSPYSPSDEGMPPPRTDSRGGPISPNSSFGRPLPQTFQSNTMVPNKSTMVEDDETDEDDDETYGLNGQVSGTSEKDAETMRAFEVQVSELEAKILDLQATLHNKDAEIESHKQDHSKARDEWLQTKEELDTKLGDSQKTLDTLHADFEHSRADRDQSESDLRARTEQAVSDLHLELDEFRRENDMLRANAASSRSLEQDGNWQHRYEELEQELVQQQKITDEVRHNAETHLQEMRLLLEQNETALGKEEQLQSRIASLEAENEQWKIRYAKTRTQLRTFKASSIGLSLEHMAPGALSSKHEHLKPNGLVKDLDVTNFQISIDELLQAAREASSAPHSALEKAKDVVQSVRNMTSNIEGSFSNVGSPHSSTTHLSQTTVGPTPTALKIRVSRDANNLVTVTRNHAAANGLAPVSLVDAAASNLTTSVVELVKVVGIRGTQDQDDDDSSLDGDDMEIEEIAPLSMSGNKPVLVKAPVPPQKQQVGTGWFSMLKGGKSEHSDDEDEYDYS